MTKRFRVMSGAALAVVGVAVLAGGMLGSGGSLEAASVAEAGTDLTKYFVWGGVGALIISALLFISASAE